MPNSDGCLCKDEEGRKMCVLELMDNRKHNGVVMCWSWEAVT